MKRDALVILSGGQDSTTALFWAKELFNKVHAITFNYSQRHFRELECAQNVGALAEVASHEMIVLGPILKGTSPLTNPDEKLELYENFEEMERIIGDRTELTFVPMRNALFLTIAANRAACLEVYDIVTGVCQMDNANYADTRHEFVLSQEHTINKALGLRGASAMRIHSPLMNLTKAQTVQLARNNPKCWEALAYTHTAYDGNYPPTSKDHANTLRAKGFEDAGYPDPLVVRAWKEGLMQLPPTRNYDQLRATQREYDPNVALADDAEFGMKP